MRAVVLVIMIPLCVTLLGCSGLLQLTPEGRRVQLMTDPPEDLLSDYEELAVISCRHGLNARSVEANAIQCQNELRNRTAQLGGDLVVITSQRLGSTNCENCVVMVGTAYRRF